jgi:hypothetical protein
MSIDLWRLLGMVLLGAPAGVWAASHNDQLAAIQRERTQADADYARRSAECAEVFTVNACHDEARTEHRTVIRRLREQHLSIQDAQRQDNLQVYTERMRKKTEAAAAQRPPENALPEVTTATEPKPLRTQHAKPAPAKAKSRTAVDEAADRKRFQDRLTEAQEHREKVARRNELRTAKDKPKAAPLPASGAGG